METKNRLSNKVCPEGMTIEEWQVALRRETAEISSFAVQHQDNNRIWGDYLVSSGPSRYRVAFRGVRSDRNYCSCLDFRTNGLGTCKHLEAVSLYLQQDVPGYPWAGMTYLPDYTSVYVSYKGGRSVRMRIGNKNVEAYTALFREFFSTEGTLLPDKYGRLEELKERGKTISADFRCYEDVDEVVREWYTELLWQEDLISTYPSRRIPWNKEEEQSEYALLETLLYSLCYRGYGFVVGKKLSWHPHLLARLMEELYQGEGEALQQLCSFIILETDMEVLQWRQIFAQYEEACLLPIHIITEKEFIQDYASKPLQCVGIYVDRADQLKEWKHPLSLGIKRMKVNHLYMRTDSIGQLSPVQLSSILQHINPFVIGPFYKFIHTYRPIFPLQDSGENLPEELRRLTFFFGQLPDQRVEVERSAGLTNPDLEDSAPKVKVDTFVRALQLILRDPEAISLLQERLGSLL